MENSQRPIPIDALTDPPADDTSGEIDPQDSSHAGWNGTLRGFFTGLGESLTRPRRLWYLQLIALVCTLMAGELKSVEPDSWLGYPFATRFNAAKAGYKALLQRDPVPGTRYGNPPPLPAKIKGFKKS
jgi:hypothetical protein